MVEVEGYRIWGSAWVYAPFLGAFIRDKNTLREKWSQIPDNTDILVTHSPPYGIGDQVRGKPLGCEHLLERVKALKPMMHIFGHIHEGFGHYFIDGINFINPGICSPYNVPIHKPVVFDLPRRG